MVGVDQFLGRSRRFDQDAEPAEWVSAGELVALARRDRRARHAVEAVATRKESGFDFLDLAVPVEPRFGRTGVEVVERGVLHPEENLSARRQARGDQILDHFVLRVDGDGPAGELGERDAMTRAAEAQVDAFVAEALALHALADAALREQVDGALLEHAGADRGLDLLARARLDHDRGDALEVEEVGKEQSGGTRSHDGNLGFQTVRFFAARRRAGKRALKRLPLPGWLSTSSVASWRASACLAMARPRPVPPVSRERLRSTR